MITWTLLLACTGTPGTGDSTGATDSGTTHETVFDPPDWCTDAVSGELQDLVDHPAGPYFVSHPRDPTSSTPTVIFLAGGAGGRDSAEVVWDIYFRDGHGVGDIRGVLPYAADAVSRPMHEEVERVLDIVDELLSCYGGDPDQVHLAGTSNGGRAAFDLALDSPGPFATVTGVPGVPSSSWSTSSLAPLLDLRIYNGVGELDTGWIDVVWSLHEDLLAAGADSTYAEYPGEGHAVSPAWDESVLYDFWLQN